MKNKETIRVIAVLCMLVAGSQTAEAQILDRVKDKVKQTAEDRVVNKAGEATEEGMDRAEEKVKGKKKNKSSKDSKTDEHIKDGNNNTVSGNEKTEKGSLTAYSNYDFVSGDKLIYFYDMGGETDSEIPGRMLLNSGNAEIQTYQGEKILFAPAGGLPYMMPYMKEEAYLPEQFTLEFDILSNGGIGTSTDISEIRIYFRESERAGSGDAIAPVLIRLDALSGENPHYGFEAYKKNGSAVGVHHQAFPSTAIHSAQDNWRHIAVYINKNIGKLYIDQHRLAVLNQVVPGSMNMVEIEVSNNEHPVLFKNFRLAAGGLDSYTKVITEGKFIAYGIQFDVNKSALKPESMGTINEFVKIMKENPALKFEIGGHTDSDGTAARNTVLSQERADAVRNQMVNMGIAENRLTAKGYGASQPVEENNSPENKAKNRRVEFVKTP